MVKRLRTPLIYYGGKTMLADTIIDLIPPHKNWVDVFGGGAAVTVAKPPSEQEVYNDIGFVHKFFEILRYPALADELIEQLKLTPWSRQEYEEVALEWWNVGLGDIEQVRRWVVLINQGFTHREDGKSWLLSKDVNTAQAWKNHIDSLPLIVERFRHIIVEHRDFTWILDRYDNKNTCFYCDPPYMPNAHNDRGKGYVNEMSIEQHEQLLDILLHVKGQAVVSGYSSPLYDNALKDWRLKKVTRPGQIRNEGQERTDRTEQIWIKEHHHGIWQMDRQAHGIDSSVSL